MHKILTLNNIAVAGLRRLPREHPAIGCTLALLGRDKTLSRIRTAISLQADL